MSAILYFAFSVAVVVNFLLSKGLDLYVFVGCVFVNLYGCCNATV